MQVAGVHMDVLKSSVVFEKSQQTTQIDVVAACPTLQGNGGQGMASHHDGLRVSTYNDNHDDLGLVCVGWRTFHMRSKFGEYYYNVLVVVV